MKKTVLPLSMAAVCLLPLLLSGCGKDIKLVVDPQTQQVMMNPNKGDTVTWNTPVTFSPKSPCVGGQNGVMTCKIDVDNQLIYYTCAGCPPDPEMPVGDDKDMEAMFKAYAFPAAPGPPVTAASGPPVTVVLACDTSGMTTILNNPIPASAPPNASFVAFRVVGGTNMNWTVNFGTTGVCMPNANITQAIGGCTVAIMPAASTSYPYTATAGSCTMPATGMLTVKPSGS
jgi:hypothetical protein